MRKYLMLVSLVVATLLLCSCQPPKISEEQIKADLAGSVTEVFINNNKHAFDITDIVIEGEKGTDTGKEIVCLCSMSDAIYEYENSFICYYTYSDNTWTLDRYEPETEDGATLKAISDQAVEDALETLHPEDYDVCELQYSEIKDDKVEASYYIEFNSDVYEQYGTVYITFDLVCAGENDFFWEVYDEDWSNVTENELDSSSIYTGTYRGSSGITELILEEGGGGYYSQGGWGAYSRRISWWIEGQTIYVDIGPTTICADASEGLSNLYFSWASGSSNWNTELYHKVS